MERLLTLSSQHSKASLNVDSRSEDVVGINFEAFSILPDMFSIFVSIEGLPHVKRILAVLRHSGRIVRVIPYHRSKSGITHALVHFDRVLVALADKKIHKPGILVIARLLQSLTQKLTIA